MKTKFDILVCLIFCIFAGCSSPQNLTSTQIPGQLPKPELPEEFSGKWTITLDGSSTVIRECMLVNGRINGVQRFWYQNGQLKTEEEYALGVKDGRFATWDEDGVLSSEQVWREGKQHGPVRTWHKGVTTLEGNYIENKKHGRWIVRKWSGELVADGFYEMGVPLNGTFIIQEGKGMHVDRYQDGKLIEKGTQQ